MRTCAQPRGAAGRNASLRQWRAPLYRSPRIAAEAGVRAAIHFILIAIIFVMAGWPSTELCLSLAAVIIGLERDGSRSARLHDGGGLCHADRMRARRHPEIPRLQRRIRVSIAGDRPCACRDRRGAADHAAERRPAAARPAVPRVHACRSRTEQSAELRPASIRCDVSVCPAFRGSGLRGAAPAAVLVGRTADPAAAGRGPSRAEPPRFRASPASRAGGSRVSRCRPDRADPDATAPPATTPRVVAKRCAASTRPTPCDGAMPNWTAWPRARSASGARRASRAHPARGGAILAAAEALRQTAAQSNLSVEPVLAALVPAKSRSNHASFRRFRPGDASMTNTYRELVMGGVLIAPIVSYAATALLAFLMLRPVLRFVGFAKFSATRRWPSSASTCRCSACSRSFLGRKSWTRPCPEMRPFRPTREPPAEARRTPPTPSRVPA